MVVEHAAVESVRALDGLLPCLAFAKILLGVGRRYPCGVVGAAEAQPLAGGGLAGVTKPQSKIMASFCVWLRWARGAA